MVKNRPTFDFVGWFVGYCEEEGWLSPEASKRLNGEIHQTTISEWMRSAKRGRRIALRGGHEVLEKFHREKTSAPAIEADRVRRLVRDVVDGGGAEGLASELTLREKFLVAQEYALMGRDGEAPLDPDELAKLARIQTRRLKAAAARNDATPNDPTGSDPH
jgi:hypothetical protein